MARTALISAGVGLALLAGCHARDPAPVPEPQASASRQPEASDEPTDYPLAVRKPARAVPPELVGSWRYAREECEADYDRAPDALPRDMVLTLASTGTYRLDGSDWAKKLEAESPRSGNIRVDRIGDGQRVQLDNWLNFDLVEGRLENWSEGEAVYQCGAIFERDGA